MLWTTNEMSSTLSSNTPIHHGTSFNISRVSKFIKFTERHNLRLAVGTTRRHTFNEVSQPWTTNTLTVSTVSRVKLIALLRQPTKRIAFQIITPSIELRTKQLPEQRKDGYLNWTFKTQIWMQLIHEHQTLHVIVSNRDAPKRVFSLRPNRTESGS